MPAHRPPSDVRISGTSWEALQLGKGFVTEHFCSRNGLSRTIHAGRFSTSSGRFVSPTPSAHCRLKGCRYQRRSIAPLWCLVGTIFPSSVPTRRGISPAEPDPAEMEQIRREIEVDDQEDDQ
jgi:hypothetical protein